MWQYLTNGGKMIDTSTLFMAGKATLVAFILIPLFFGISFGWRWINKNTNDEARPMLWDKKYLARAASLYFMMIAYVPIFGAVALGFSTMSKIFEMNDNTRQEYKVFLKEVTMTNLKQMEHRNDLKREYLMEISQSENDDELADEITEKNDISDFDLSWYEYLYPTNWVPLILYALVYLIVSLIKFLTGTFAVACINFFFVVGPLAIAFSYFDWFKDQFQEWVTTYFTCCAVLVSLNIADNIFTFVMTQFVNNVGHFNRGDVVGSDGSDIANYDNVTILIGKGIIMIVLYIKVFTFTSKWVGRSDAGKLVAGAASMGSAALAYMALKGMKGGGGSGGGSLAQDVAGELKKGFKK